MAKWIQDSTVDALLAEIAESDGESICNGQPATYFNACHPEIWVQGTAYVVGDLVRPPTVNGYIYECIDDGVAGAVEPGWGTSQDATFSDGGVMWTTHINFTLAYSPLVPGDKTIGSNTGPAGRNLTIGQKIGVVTHRAGTVTHTALINDADKKLQYVSTAETTLAVNDEVEAGRTTIFFEWKIVVAYPV